MERDLTEPADSAMLERAAGRASNTAYILLSLLVKDVSTTQRIGNSLRVFPPLLFFNVSTTGEKSMVVAADAGRAGLPRQALR